MEATKKDLINYCSSRGKKLISASYCEFQDVTNFGIPTFQNFGLYGWNWTAYEFDTCVICTGYRNTVGHKIDFKKSDEFDKKVENIFLSPDFSYDEKREKILKMLEDLVESENISSHWGK